MGCLPVGTNLSSQRLLDPDEHHSADGCNRASLQGVVHLDQTVQLHR